MQTAGTLLMAATAVLFLMAGILHTRGRRDSLDDYLTTRNSLGTTAGAATLLASSMGAWILFSPAEAGTWGGLTAVGGYALGSALALWAYALLGPRLRELLPAGSSLTEFVYFRYGTITHTLVVAVSLFYMGTFLAAEMTAVALAVNLVAGTPLTLTAAVVGGATLIYTAYGGMRASVFTDQLQSLLILPLLAVILAATLWVLGGPSRVAGAVMETAPSLLDPLHAAGWETAITLVVAIVGANLFHQGYWQRVYACRDSAIVTRAFLVGGLLVIPAITGAGLFGILAVAAGPVEEASAALFHLLLAAAPPWAVLAGLVLVVALVMSSADTLMNGLASLFTTDLARLRPHASAGTLLGYARLATVAVAAVAVWVAAQGYSVLYLFLLADLVCVAAVFPVFFGLYTQHLPGWAAALATAAGMAAGIALFPDPAFSRGSMLWAFMTAAALPAAVSLALARAGTAQDPAVPAAGVRPPAGG